MWLALAWLAATVGGAAAAAQEDAGTAVAKPTSGCAQAISPENAQKLFSEMKDLHGEDGCSLEEMKTENDLMRIELRKGGVPLPLLEIRPIACGRGTVNGPAFSLVVPTSAAEKCPAAIRKLSALVATERFGRPVEVVPFKPRYRLFALAGAGGGLLVIGALLLWWRRRRKASL